MHQECKHYIVHAQLIWDVNMTETIKIRNRTQQIDK